MHQNLAFLDLEELAPLNHKRGSAQSPFPSVHKQMIMMMMYINRDVDLDYRSFRSLIVICHLCEGLHLQETHQEMR